MHNPDEIEHTLAEQDGQQWENPANPEKAGDSRDLEQLERQKKEAELRKSNLTDSEGK